MQFLSGMNKEFDQVKVNILSSDPLPNVHKAYYILQQVEQQNKLNNVTAVNDMSALQAQVLKTFPKPAYQTVKKDVKRQKSEIVCEHCKKKGHVIEQCFKLVEYLEWWTTLKGKKNSKMAGNVQNNGDGILERGPQEIQESSTSNKLVDPVMASAIYNEVLKMIQQNCKATTSKDNPLYTTANFAGIFSASNFDCIMKKLDCDNWIIDTGATDHMASNLGFFASLK